MYDSGGTKLSNGDRNSVSSPIAPPRKRMALIRLVTRQTTCRRTTAEWRSKQRNSLDRCYCQWPEAERRVYTEQAQRNTCANGLSGVGDGSNLPGTTAMASSERQNNQRPRARPRLLSDYGKNQAKCFVSLPETSGRQCAYTTCSSCRDVAWTTTAAMSGNSKSH